MYDFKTCQGKLNIAYDTHLETTKLITNMPHNTTSFSLITTPNSTKKIVFDYFHTSTYQSILSQNHTINAAADTNKLTNNNKDIKKQQCGHVITTYLLPSLMHLAAYILGFVYFRINENEQLYALMEKVFLAVNQTLKLVSQDRVIKRLK
jgi:hypothetical protein